MLVLDHDRAGGYWGSVYVFTAIKGLQVIIDGPVGLREPAGDLGAALHRRAAAARAADRRHRTGRGRARPARHREAMKRAHATLDPDLPSVVVTGSIAEMIGGGVTPEGTNIQRFLPRTIDEDQWQSADRAMYWLWTRVRPQEGAQRRSRASRRREAAGQHHRADLRHLQHGLGSGRDPPAGRGHRCRDQHGVPARQPSRGRRRSSPTPTSTSACIASSAACCARRWSGPTCRRRSACTARPRFLRKLGELLDLDPEPFIEREKHTTIKPLWDLWRSVTQDFFGTASFAHRRQRDLRARRAAISSKTRWGCPARSRFARTAGREARQRRGARRRCARRPPLMMFGSYNERMYLAEAGGARDVHPGVVPRRASSGATPARRSWATRGATYLVQEVCNALFDALFNILPLATELDRSRRRRSRLHRELPWDERPGWRCSAWSRPSRCWCASRPPSGCAMPPSARHAPRARRR